jgi:hypothetical protein
VLETADFGFSYLKSYLAPWAFTKIRSDSRNDMAAQKIICT